MEGFWGGLVIAVIDFIMVFLVLGGLALVIGVLKRLVAFLENQRTEITTQVETVAPEPVSVAPVEEKTTDIHIAAMLAAIQEFTSLPLGAFTIDTIEPVASEELNSMQLDQERQKKALIAAISIAIHEFTSMPMGSFRITGIKPLGRVSVWKMAGRLELMGMDAD